MKNIFLVCAAMIIGISALVVQHLPHEKFKERETEALDALQFISMARAFPNKDIAPDAYANAIDWYNQRKAQSKTNSSLSSAPWSSIGPVNIGGRTLCVRLNPTDTSEVWLGSASGGLWKSNTGGLGFNAWQYVPIGFPVLGVASIAFNPQNTNEMLIGTGETYFTGNNTNGLIDRTTRGIFGMGMYKTTNGGASWTQVLNWTYQQGRCVWDVEYNPLNPNTVYAATTEGVYKSTNGGNTWTQVLNQSMCMDLEIHGIDTNIVLCGVGNLGSTSHGIYRTTNSGSSWMQINSIIPTTNTGKISLAKYSNNNDIMYAHVCDTYSTIGFYKSTDKGATWTLNGTVDVGGYQGWYCGGLLIQPVPYFSAGRRSLCLRIVQ